MKRPGGHVPQPFQLGRSGEASVPQRRHLSPRAHARAAFNEETIISGDCSA